MYTNVSNFSGDPLSFSQNHTSHADYTTVSSALLNFKTKIVSNFKSFCVSIHKHIVNVIAYKYKLPKVNLLSSPSLFKSLGLVF